MKERGTDQQPVLHLIEVFKVSPPCVMSLKIKPDFFHGIQLRRVRGQENKFHIVGHLEFEGAMPSRAIQHDHITSIGMLSSQDVEMSIHSLRVHVRRDQGAHLTGFRTDTCEQGEILSGLPIKYFGSFSSSGPPSSNLRHQTESRLVLEKQFLGEAMLYFRDQTRKFFLNSSAAFGLAL